MAIDIKPPSRQLVKRMETRFALQQDDWNDYSWLGQEAVELLANFNRIAKVPWMFWNQRTRKPFTAVQTAWEHARDAAGLRDFRLHDLRHTFASHAAMGRESLPMIGKLLGHSCAKSTARYAHLDDAHLLDAAETIGAAIESAMLSGR